MTPSNAIPDFENLYNVVRDYVKEHQGKRGYIDTQDDSNDTISAFIYEDFCGQIVEQITHGVRVNPENDALEVVIEPMMRTYEIEYSDEEFKTADWIPVLWSDIYPWPTVLQIAESIEQYA